MTPEISLHGFERGKERLSLTKRAVKRLAQRALDLGISHREATGPLKRYLDGLFLAHMKGNNIRIYAETVFIFECNFLITVYQLPNEYKKLARKLNERRTPLDH
jgi:hypothetical protein